MSNLEKAAQVVYESCYGRNLHPGQVSSIVRGLDGAGLLAPDLPEPDSHDEHGWPVYGNGEYQTYFSKHPCKGIPYIATPLSPWMDAESVRKEAYRLLAAAEWLDNWDKEHAEKEQGNE